MRRERVDRQDRRRLAARQHRFDRRRNRRPVGRPIAAAAALDFLRVDSRVAGHEVAVGDPHHQRRVVARRGWRRSAAANRSKAPPARRAARPAGARARRRRCRKRCGARAPRAAGRGRRNAGGKRVGGVVADDEDAAVERAGNLLQRREIVVSLACVAPRPRVHAAPLPVACGENKDSAARRQLIARFGPGNRQRMTQASPTARPQGGFGAPFAALVVGALAMGISPIFVRLADVGPFASAFWRVTLALPLLWAWLRIAEAREPSDGRIGRADIFAGLAFAGDLFFWHLSIVTTSVANATFFATMRADLGGGVRLAHLRRARGAQHAGGGRPVRRRRRRAAGAELSSPSRRRDRRSLRHRHRRLLRPLFPRGEGGAARSVRRRGSPSTRPSSPPRCC